MSADNTDAAVWLRDLHHHLPMHAEAVTGMLEAARSRPAARLLAVGCSLGRGSGDDHSDIDVALALEPADWAHASALSAEMVHAAGAVMDLYQRREPELRGVLHLRTFAVLESGVVIDLMTRSLDDWHGSRAPDLVILHDPGAVISAVVEPPAALAEELHEWTWRGWEALANLDKYLRRGSVWEAREQLEEARRQVFRLWAVVQRLPQPVYGLAELLDTSSPVLPPGIEATVAGLDLEEQRRAGLHCAGLLAALWEEAIATLTGEERAGPAVSAFVESRLEELSFPRG